MGEKQKRSSTGRHGYTVIDMKCSVHRGKAEVFRAMIYRGVMYTLHTGSIPSNKVCDVAWRGHAVLSEVDISIPPPR